MSGDLGTLCFGSYLGPNYFHAFRSQVSRSLVALDSLGINAV